MTRIADVVEMTFGFAFKSAEFSDAPDDVRLLRGDNIAQGRLRWNGAKRFPMSRIDEVKRYQLAAGDVVVAMDRPWIEAGLKYSVVRKEDVPSLLVQRVARLRTKSDSLDQSFLGWVIGSAAFTNYVVGVQTGSAVPHISGKQIGDFEFVLPQIEVQRAIAATLGALDDKIESNLRKISLIWELAASKWDRITDRAASMPLATIMRLSYGKALPANTRTPGNVPVYGSSGITGWHNVSLVDGPAVIIGRKGTVGAVHWSDTSAFPIDTTFFVDPQFGWPLLACYFAARNASLSEMNSDSAVPGLNKDRALAAETPLPALDAALIWAKEAAPLTGLSREIALETESLTILRDALLPGLLSGCIRVSPEEVR